MNQDLIRCTNLNCQPNLFVRLPGIAYDERVRYIESVCQVLIESRFGSGRVEPVVINFSNHPELDPPLYDFFDERPNGVIPSYALSPLSSLRRRTGYQVVKAAYQRAKQMGLVDAAPNAHNSTAALPPNQGRGSP